jgi:basic membrane protein A and related proteins
MELTRRHVLTALAAGGTLVGGGSRLFAANTPMKVAIVMPGSITDGGWSQAGFDAMAKAKAQLGIETAYSEKVHQPEQVEALSDYARRGYTHIIGHGGEFQDAVDRVAARFSNTTFIVTNGVLANKNVATADFYFSQPAYLLGFLAGRVTKTGKVGIIAAQKFKFTTDTVAGYEAGFKAARSDGQVITTWTGDWDDVAKGKEAAINQLSQGADIIWPTMDSATTGSLQAVREKGAMALGLYYDAIEKWPDIILQSAILDVRGLILALLEMAKNTGLHGKNYKFDFNSPTALRLGSFHSKVPLPVASEVNGLLEKMKSGSFVVQPV